MSSNNRQNQSQVEISLSNDDLQKKIANSLTFHDNLGERILTISESKLKLCLNDNIENMENRSAWQAPAGILFTILVTILTSNFKDLILSKSDWRAIFICFGLLTSVWLLKALYKMPKIKKVGDIVNELMPQNEVVQKQNKKR